jgi:hypothetical protein
MERYTTTSIINGQLECMKSLFDIERSSKRKLIKYLPMPDKEGGSS